MNVSWPSARLVLVRHGRSAHQQRGWVDADGFRQWRTAYESAGIQLHDLPPVPLRRLAVSASLIVSSDAPRAVESALRLREGQHPSTPLLRELELALPDLSAMRMPLTVWALRIGARMALARRRGAFPPPQERERIVEAAAWLETLAESHACVVVVTHAAFRSQLARLCLQRGWRAAGGNRSMANWSAWQLVRDGSQGTA